MTLADARARCPELASLPHDPEADELELERLSARMARFTPIAVVDPPHGLMLDITGCAHLFGGEAAMTRAVLAEAAFTARPALAAHPAMARALARYGADESDVRALPVAALELPEDALAGLRRAGLSTVGDLAARPRAALAARFGEAAVTRLMAVLGERDTPLAAFRPAAPLRARACFAEPITRTENVLEVIEDLLTRLVRRMETLRLGGRRFAVLLERTDGARRQLAVETGQPTRDPARIARLLREQIDSLSDPLDPGFGFDAVAVAVTRSEPRDPVQIDIENETRGEREDIAALVDRLTTRFGPEHVLRLAPCDTHVPEASQQALPALRPAPALPWPDPAARPPRPLFLLDPPQRIESMAGVPDGPPQRFRWRGRLHQIALAEGPERIAAEWWREPEGHLPGSTALTRDYYRVEDDEGARYWVFRHGLFDETGSPNWYLHGLFA